MRFPGKTVHAIAVALSLAKDISAEKAGKNAYNRQGHKHALDALEVVTTDKEHKGADLLSEEDSNYWGRILQDESSMPSLPCDVKVEISCVTEDGTECVDIEAEPGPDECMETIHLTYTVSNIGTTTETIDSLSRTLNAVFEDLTDGLESTVLLPGESTEVKESEVISVCEAMTFTINAEVNASPPNGPSCSDDDEYVFTPKVICDCDCEVTISCETVDEGIECRDIPPAETPEDCLIDIRYTYTVSNFGNTNSEIITLTRERGGETKDLYPLLEKTILTPNENTDVSETENIDICEGTTFTTKAFLTTNCLHCTSRPERALEEARVNESHYTLKTGSNKGLRLGK